MGDMLKELREKSRKRKLLLAQTVSFIEKDRKLWCHCEIFQLGVSGAEELSEVLGTAEGTVKKKESEPNSYHEMEKYDYKKESLDEMIYRDSSLFLKVFLESMFMILFTRFKQLTEGHCVVWNYPLVLL